MIKRYLQLTRIGLTGIALVLGIELLLTLTGSPVQAAPQRLNQPGTPQSPSTPVPAATPSVGERPDSCEHSGGNGSPERACQIAVDAVSGPYTFLPEGDQDFYRVDLGQPNGLETSIVVRGSGNLNLLTTMSHADGSRITAISSPAISTTLAADVSGGIVIRVEKRNPESASGQTYVVEVRRTLPPAPPALATPLPGLAAAPDRLENNWSPNTAAPIAVGTVYDLTFACPVPGGCEGGDHDYLRVPVKANASYLIATFDLGPGADTVLDLFWADQLMPLVSNDDLPNSTGFLSAIHWRAPTDGTALVRVAPRSGGLNPLVFEDHASAYRFAVALAGSELARQLEVRIAEQSGLTITSPTPVAAGDTEVAPPPAQPALPPTIRPVTSDGSTGQAMTIAETRLLVDPDLASDLIQVLPPDQFVRLTGQSSGQWVRVEPVDGVLPGWVLGASLKRAESRPTPVPSRGDSPVVPPPGASTDRTSSAQDTGATREAQSGAASPWPTMQVARLPPLALTPSPMVPRVALNLKVRMVKATGNPKTEIMPITGMRLQLVNVFGDVLIEALTLDDGTVSFTRDLAPGVAVRIRVPAAALEAPVDLTSPTLTIALPQGDNL